MANKKISELTSGSLSNLSLNGVLPVVYSGITFQHTLSHLRNVLVDSGSHVFTGSQVINGNLVISGSVTAQEYILSSSFTNITIESISGSTKFGDTLNDVHQFTGSLNITGGLTATGSIRFPNLVIGSGTFDSPNPEILHVQNSGSTKVADFSGDDSYYMEFVIRNNNSTNNASSDLVLEADNATDTVHYVNLGINSSTYTGGVVGLANDSYLINSGKDMYVGTLGGPTHPSKLFLFAENQWSSPQVMISGSKQVGFNISSVTNGYVYEFSGSAKMNHNTTIDGFTILSQVSSSLNFVDDSAAASGGVPLGGLYRSGSFVLIRLT